VKVRTKRRIWTVLRYILWVISLVVSCKYVGFLTAAIYLICFAIIWRVKNYTQSLAPTATLITDDVTVTRYFF